MLKVNEVIIVEGRYDKNTLSQIVDATIIETSGFGIFNDTDKQKLIKRLAEERGIIIMTDPDGAGLVIRNRIKSFVDPKYIRNVYVPGIAGKERRKSKMSKAGVLGVEGLSREVLEEAFKQAGITGDCSGEKRQQITKADLYRRGLTGKQDSACARSALLKKLDLPTYLSCDAMLEVLNVLLTRDAFFEIEL